MSRSAKMVSLSIAVLVLSAVFAAAYPANDPVIGTFSKGLRYDYLEDDAGQVHLVDNWLKISDYDRLARYNPDQSNVYHLFTRANPSVSQPLVLNNAATVTNSNFNRNRRTIVLMHGFLGSASSLFNAAMLPAFLAAGDVNVIVLDWSAGSTWGPRATAAGEAAGRFINWLNNLTGATPNNYHLCGFSVGGHGVGAMGRTVNGNVLYITALDPANRWDTNLLLNPSHGSYTEAIHTNGGDSGWLEPIAHVDFYPNGGQSMPGCLTALCHHNRVSANRWDISLLLNPSHGSYTEAIHTNAGDSGWLEPIAHVDFYPNGGQSMPGCLTALCHHNRAYHYMDESVRSGGFTGNRCTSLQNALNGNCGSGATLRMGGTQPKPGSTGIYHLVTNSRQPFSRG